MSEKGSTKRKDANQTECCEEKKALSGVDKQILIEFYKAQWNDIRALDELDWRVALIFIPLIGAVSFVFGIALELDLKELNIYTSAIKIISFISFLICLYGLWTVAKGQSHSILRFKTIKNIEEKLDLRCYMFDRDEEVSGLWKVGVSRRTVLFIVYSILAFLSFSMTVVPIQKSKFDSILREPNRAIVFAIPLLFIVIIIWIHWRDYRLYKRVTCERE